MPPIRTSSPALTPAAVNVPADASTARSYAAGAGYRGQLAGSLCGHGSISAMPTTRPSAAHAIDNGMRVWYIQKAPSRADGKRKSMPVPGSRRSRCMSPWRRSAGVSAISTRSGAVSPTVTWTASRGSADGFDRSSAVPLPAQPPTVRTATTTASVAGRPGDIAAGYPGNRPTGDAASWTASQRGVRT